MTASANVMQRLPERDRPPIEADSARRGRRPITRERLGGCAASRTSSGTARPGVAASLREGMEETLTMIRLGIEDRPRRTLIHPTRPSR